MYCASLSTSTAPLIHCLNLLSPRSTFASMAAAASSSDDHTIGDWFSVPDLKLRDHFFKVPLDYSLRSNSFCPKITVFAREVVSAGKEDQSLPYLLYLQGGPGFESPRPTDSNGWIGKACEDYRVVFVEQACQLH
ncbi:Proline iminopeptidase [Bienertia sinuspersici]